MKQRREDWSKGRRKERRTKEKSGVSNNFAVNYIQGNFGKLINQKVKNSDNKSKEIEKKNQNNSSNNIVNEIKNKFNIKNSPSPTKKILINRSYNNTPCSFFNNKDSNYMDFNSPNIERDNLNSFLKSNDYLDSDPNNFINYDIEKNLIGGNNLIKIEDDEQGEIMEFNQVKKTTSKSPKKLTDFSKNKKPLSPQNELDKKNKMRLNLNEFLITKNINFQSINNLNLITGKNSLNASSGHLLFKNSKKPNSFRKVFTPNILKASSVNQNKKN